MSRLTIDISDQQHQSLKAIAALQGKTIKQYALERLFPGNVGEEQALAKLKSLLSERISAGLAGDVSSKTVAGILNEEMNTGSNA